jgi:D-methionine transport system permease protein
MDSNSTYELLTAIMLPEFLKTLYMVGVATVASILCGVAVGIVLILTYLDGLRSNKIVYQTMDALVNVVRSLPVIILIVAIIPLTRFIAGTSIGENAAIVPLTIAGTPVVARIIEGSFREVDKELIEAARSFGASNFQIVFRVMLPEAVPAIISGLTLAIIPILGFTAMAGAVGAGGLGAVAVTYGYVNFNDTIMYVTVVVLIMLVQVLRSLGNIIYRMLK